MPPPALPFTRKHAGAQCLGLRWVLLILGLDACCMLGAMRWGGGQQLSPFFPPPFLLTPLLFIPPTAPVVLGCKQIHRLWTVGRGGDENRR